MRFLQNKPRLRDPRPRAGSAGLGGERWKAPPDGNLRSFFHMARWQAMKPLRRAAHTAAGSAEPKPFCFLMKPHRFSRANWAASRPPCPSHTAKKATERRGRRPEPQPGPGGGAPSSAARGPPALRRTPSPGAAPPLCAGPRSAAAGGSGSTTIWVTSSMYFLPPWSEYTLTPSEYGPSMGREAPRGAARRSPPAMAAAPPPPRTIVAGGGAARAWPRPRSAPRQSPVGAAGEPRSAPQRPLPHPRPPEGAAASGGASRAPPGGGRRERCSGPERRRPPLPAVSAPPDGADVRGA